MKFGLIRKKKREKMGIPDAEYVGRRAAIWLLADLAGSGRLGFLVQNEKLQGQLVFPQQKREEGERPRPLFGTGYLESQREKSVSSLHKFRRTSRWGKK